MSTKADVLHDISKNGWIFNRIQPLFNSALEENLSSGKSISSTLQLTLHKYLNIHFSNNDCEMKFVGSSNFKNPSDFGRLGKKIYSGGKEGIFTEYDKALVTETITHIKSKHNELESTISAVFKGFFRISGGNFCGASHPHAFGMYFVGDKFFKLSLAERSLSLIHELAYQELFLVQLLDRLVESSADFNLVHAPYQGKSRPPIGRLHSMAALSRMIQFSKLFNGNGVTLMEKFNETKNLFQKGELTPYGLELVEAYSTGIQKL